MSNPSGSIKDRMVYYILNKALKTKKLKKGMEIIEITSGNTGISLSMFSTILGIKFTAIMPESMSVERIKMMRSFNSNIITTKKEEDMFGALKKYNQIIKNKKNIFLPKQFENIDNINSYKFFAKEITKQVKNIDAFVAGIGTGGTIIGTAKVLKKINPNIKIIGIEPYESPIITKNKSGLHKIQGIGEGFIPKIVKDNLHLIDKVITIKSKDAKKQRKNIIKKYGLMVGISSGANFLGAKKIKKQFKNVVTVFPDRGERYLSESDD